MDNKDIGRQSDDHMEIERISNKIQNGDETETRWNEGKFELYFHGVNYEDVGVPSKSTLPSAVLIHIPRQIKSLKHTICYSM